LPVSPFAERTKPVTVGFPQTLSDLNSQAGSLSVALRTDMVNIQRFQTQLAAIPDATLLAAPIGLAQADINVLRSAFADMNDLANVYEGIASTHLTGTYDYRTFSKLLWGFV
jgi:hypothetical protein